MKYFLIKGFKGASNDKFMMKPSDDFILFVAFGLKDLENTLKGILPKGYRIKRKETLSRRLKQWGGFEMRSLFNVPVVEVKEIDFKPPVEKDFDFHNTSRDQNFNLKVVKTEHWEEEKEPAILS